MVVAIAGVETEAVQLGDVGEGVCARTGHRAGEPVVGLAAEVGAPSAGEGLEEMAHAGRVAGEVAVALEEVPAAGALGKDPVHPEVEKLQIGQLGALPPVGAMGQGGIKRLEKSPGNGSVG